MDTYPSELALLHAALESLPDAVMVLRAVRDRAGAIVDFEWAYANHHAAALIGLDHHELPGRRLLELVPRCREDGSFERYARVAETGAPDELDTRCDHGRGGTWLTHLCTRVGDGVTVICREREPFERSSPSSPWGQVQLLFEQAPFAIAVVQGPEHRYVVANPSYEHMVGRQGIVGKRLREVFPEFPPDAEVVGMLDEVRRSGRPYSTTEYEVAIDVDGDGTPEPHFYQFTCAPVCEGREVVAIHMVAVDVTAQVRSRRQAEEMAERLEDNVAERKAAEAALREADRQKDEFLAMLSHELRNPLAVVRSATELLETVATSDVVMPRVHKVLQRQTSHMARLLDDLLDLARITSGKLTLEPTRFDLREVVREVVSDLEPVMRQQLRFTVDLPDDPVWVHGDRVRLAQVTHNLLGNALKYTPPSGTVGLRLHADRGGAVVTVTDTGIGLDPELQPHLFQPFRQGPQDIARSAGGLGLGLAVSKTIVELHHGTIEARSPGRNRGSEFEVWLPLARPEAGAAASEPVRSRAAMRFLVVEDNEDGADLLAALLRARGYDVEIAVRGREALETMQAWSPDVVICDIGLPDIDGHEVARSIRADPRHAHVKLVALSGYGQDEDRRRSQEAGFDVHFTKPADVDAMLHAVGQPGAR
jgi:signal transduction histidine kinase